MTILEKIPYIFEGLDWWLEFGTLLGLIREKKIIDWDDDLDIGVMEESFTPENLEKIRKKCEEFGFYFNEKEFNGLRRIHYSIANQRLYCEAWTFKKDENNMIYAPSTWTQAMHEEKFTKNKDILVFNNISYNIPSNVSEFLAIRYGDWMTPEECRRSYRDGRSMPKKYSTKFKDQNESTLVSVIEDHKKNKY